MNAIHSIFKCAWRNEYLIGEKAQTIIIVIVIITSPCNLVFWVRKVKEQWNIKPLFLSGNCEVSNSEVKRHFPPREIRPKNLRKTSFSSHNLATWGRSTKILLYLHLLCLFLINFFLLPTSLATITNFLFLKTWLSFSLGSQRRLVFPGQFVMPKHWS